MSDTNYYYGFTIKNIQANTQREEWEVQLQMVSMIKYHKALLVDFFVEYDSLKRPHIHGTMMARKGLFLSRFKVPYWTIHIDPLRTMDDIKNWSEYIRKDQKPKEVIPNQLDDYCFIDDHPTDKTT